MDSLHKLSMMEIVDSLADIAADRSFSDLDHREDWLFIETVLRAAVEGCNLTFSGDWPTDHAARKRAATAVRIILGELKP